MNLVIDWPCDLILRLIKHLAIAFAVGLDLRRVIPVRLARALGDLIKG